jgi:hypothetical protein
MSNTDPNKRLQKMSNADPTKDYNGWVTRTPTKDYKRRATRPNQKLLLSHNNIFTCSILPLQYSLYNHSLYSSILSSSFWLGLVALLL